MKEAALTYKDSSYKQMSQKLCLKLAILDQLEFPVLTVRLWSDSQISIKYICTTSKKFSVFVMKRLNEIQLNSTITEWN